MLSPATPDSRRERILGIGPFGTGKTTNWINIAKWSAATESPAQFYVIDTDNALEAFLEPGTQYEHLDAKRGGNIHWTAVFEWEDYVAAANDIASKSTPNDFVVIDFISNAWEAVQNYYVEEVFKQDIAEFFFETRKAMKGGNPLDGWKDWQYINRLYKSWINVVLHRAAGHKYFTAQAESLRESDDRAMRSLFGTHGVRPKGQKELGFQAHTVLLSSGNRAGETFLTTIKDRERTPIADLQVKEFTIDYLTNIAGWTL